MAKKKNVSETQVEIIQGNLDMLTVKLLSDINNNLKLIVKSLEKK